MLTEEQVARVIGDNCNFRQTIKQQRQQMGRLNVLLKQQSKTNAEQRDLIDKLNAQVVQQDETIRSLRADANRFTAIRRCIAFNAGCFIMGDKDDIGRTVIGIPVESICYATVGEGHDERSAVDDMVANDYTPKEKRHV